MQVNSGAEYNLSGSGIISGAITIDAPTAIPGGTSTPGGVFNLSDNGTISNTVTNSGTFGMTGGSISNADTDFTVTNNAGATFSISNGTIDEAVANSGTFNLSGTGAITGTVTNNAGATFDYGGGSFTSIANAGNLNFSTDYTYGAHTITGNGTMSNTAGTTFTLSSGTLSQAFTVGGTFNLSGTGATTGLVTVQNAGIFTQSGGSSNDIYIEAGGSGSLSGADATVTGNVTNYGTFGMTGGSIQGTGKTVQNISTETSTGTFDLSGGQIYNPVANSGTFNLSGTGIISGAVTTSNDFNMSAGTITANVTVTGGTFDMTGGSITGLATLSGGTTTVSGGTWENFNTGVDVNTVQDATLTIGGSETTTGTLNLYTLTLNNNAILNLEENGVLGLSYQLKRGDGANITINFKGGTVKAIGDDALLLGAGTTEGSSHVIFHENTTTIFDANGKGMTMNASTTGTKTENMGNIKIVDSSGSTSVGHIIFADHTQLTIGGTIIVDKASLDIQNAGMHGTNLTITNAGSVEISSAYTTQSSFTGEIVVDNGVLELHTTTPFGDASTVDGPDFIQVNSSGTLTFHSTDSNIFSPIKVNGGTVSSAGTGTLLLSNKITSDGGGTISVPLTLQNTTAQTIEVTNDTLNINNTISGGTGITSFTKTGAGTLSLSGNTSLNQVVEAGTLARTDGTSTGTVTVGDADGTLTGAYTLSGGKQSGQVTVNTGSRISITGGNASNVEVTAGATGELISGNITEKLTNRGTFDIGTATSDGTASLIADNYGTLRLNTGTITGTVTNYGEDFTLSGGSFNGTITNESTGNMIISGSTIAGTTQPVANAILNNKNTVTMTSGTLEHVAINITSPETRSANFTIDGGTIESTATFNVTGNATHKANLYINGGEPTSTDTTGVGCGVTVNEYGYAEVNGGYTGNIAVHKDGELIILKTGTGAPSVRNIHVGEVATPGGNVEIHGGTVRGSFANYGTINQSGGTVNDAGWNYAAGDYTLSGGTILGGGSFGFMNSGGSVTIEGTGEILTGFRTNNNGSVTMTGGKIDGYLQISYGTASFTGGKIVGTSTSGVYGIDGVTVGEYETSGGATFTINPGTDPSTYSFTTDKFSVGVNAASGTVNHLTGDISATESVELGVEKRDLSGTGRYNLVGGSVTTPTFTVNTGSTLYLPGLTGTAADGTVTGDVTNAGTLELRNRGEDGLSSTEVVAASYTESIISGNFNNTGLLSIGVLWTDLASEATGEFFETGDANGRADWLKVSNATDTDPGTATVTLSGNLWLELGNATQWTEADLGTYIPIIYSDTMITGTFDSVSWTSGMQDGLAWEFVVPGQVDDPVAASTSAGGLTTMAIGNEGKIGYIRLVESQTQVPEPATWGMMLLGLAGLLYFCRRKQA
ncbi:MAG: PEP-CTERM sorting domain-containing protein [Planctomycetia bacterium]|nr:PEP-CTERM sorting domain-containing protein [Planctomycetia bacterium]